MKLILAFLLLIVTLTSCQQETKSTDSNTTDAVSGAASTSLKAHDTAIDFDKDKDKGKAKDESCDTEEDLEKQIEAAKKKPEAFKLQGGDSGCSTDP